MNTIVLTNSNAGTKYKYKLSLKLYNPMRLDNCLICISDISLYYSWPNIKASYGNNECKYKRTADNKEYSITIPDGSYEIKDLNNYIHHVMKINGDIEDDKGKYPIELYANHIYQRVTVITKDKYILELPVEGLGKVLGFTKVPEEGVKHVYLGPNKEQNGDIIPQVERVESVSVHCNLVNNRYQSENSLIYSFTPDKSFGNLLNIKPHFPYWRNTRTNTDINEIVVWFTDQDNKPLDIEDPKIRVELQIKDVNL
jgi:hypothetical protein